MKIFMQFEENFWNNETQFYLYADPIQRGATGNDLWLGFSHHFADVQQCMMRIIGTVRLVVLICQRSKHGGRYSIWSDDARRLWP